MPVAPENRHRYPADWETRIRPEIFARSGGRCECDGRCGRGVHAGRCPEVHLEPAVLGGANTTIRLTVAHLDHAPEHNAPENLMHMCQGCHLHYDIDHHRQSAIERAQRALEAAGQLRIGVDGCPA